MANRFLTDAEVFGVAPEQEKKMLTDAEVFGTPQTEASSQPTFMDTAPPAPGPVGPRASTPLDAIEAPPAFDVPEVSPPADPTADPTRGRLQSAASQLVRGPISGGLGLASKGVGVLGGNLGNVIRENVFSAQGLPEYHSYIDPEEGGPFEFGERVTEFAEETFPTNPEFEGEFLTDTLPFALGQTAFFFGTGGLGSAAGLGAGTAAAATGAAVGAGAAYDRAIQSGATEDEAIQAAHLSGVVGMSEAIPIARAFNRLNPVGAGVLQRLARRALAEGTEEALQEFGQTVADNWIDNFTYDAGRGVFEGAGEAAGTGFTVGALLGALIPGRQRFDANQQFDVPPGVQERIEPTIAPPGELAVPEVVEPAPVAEPAPAPVEPQPQPAPVVEEEAPETPVSRKADLEEILADDRPVEEIAADRRAQAAERATQAAQEAGYPAPGTRVVVQAPGEEAITGTFDEAFEIQTATGPLQGARVTADDGTVYEFEASDATIAVAPEQAVQQAERVLEEVTPEPAPAVAVGEGIQPAPAPVEEVQLTPQPTEIQQEQVQQIAERASPDRAEGDTQQAAVAPESASPLAEDVAAAAPTPEQVRQFLDETPSRESFNIPADVDQGLRALGFNPSLMTAEQQQEVLSKGQRATGSEAFVLPPSQLRELGIEPAAAEPAPTERPRRLDLGTLDITYEVTADDTGETFQVTENAKVALDNAQKRTSTLQELLDCLA